MKIKHDASSGPLLVNFIGIQEKGMWPAKKHSPTSIEEGGLALALFADLDKWLEEKTGGKVDCLMTGVVAGASAV